MKCCGIDTFLESMVSSKAFSASLHTMLTNGEKGKEQEII